jgi:transcriptional regulator with XRE-family HTH domain
MIATATVIEHQDLCDVIGDRIRQLRSARGWTQLELSLLSGVTQSTISRVESGRQPRIRGGTLQRLASTLEAPVDSLTRES